MDLKTNLGCERSWVYNVYADFSDEVPTSETLAIRFKDTEGKLSILTRNYYPLFLFQSVILFFLAAKAFKAAFEKARDENIEKKKSATSSETAAASADAGTSAASKDAPATEASKASEAAAEAKSDAADVLAESVKDLTVEASAESS